MTSTDNPAKLAEFLHVDAITDEAAAMEPSYNVAPTQQILVVAERHKVRKLGTMKWGLVPFFAKDPSCGSSMINARCESVADKPSYRRAFERRRCLIPVGGFYEWQRLAEHKRKQPWYFTTRSGEPLAFAGLWEAWRDPQSTGDTTPLITCTIVTTPANADVTDVHNRMPLILARDDWNIWLDVDQTDLSDTRSLLHPPPARPLASYRVSDRVNSANNDDATLVESIPS